MPAIKHEGSKGFGYHAYCLACKEEFSTDALGHPVRAWAKRHLREHPEHREVYMDKSRLERFTIEAPDAD